MAMAMSRADSYSKSTLDSFDIPLPLSLSIGFFFSQTITVMGILCDRHVTYD